jgi:hypothetical protein
MSSENALVRFSVMATVPVGPKITIGVFREP